MPEYEENTEGWKRWRKRGGQTRQGEAMRKGQQEAAEAEIAVR